MKTKSVLMVLWTLWFTVSPLWVWALPNGGQIAAGSGSIQSSGGSMTIQQNTQQLITNWQSFSIGAAESVTFQQPNAQATALNRVIGVDPSLIMGRLSANGQVFLSNPAGVLFGPGAQVNANALVATTLSISDQDFLDGNYRFFQDPTRSLASVINEGRITGRYVGLFAPAVENRGVIVANLGSVALASGEAGTLDFTGDNLIRFAITQPVSGEVRDTNGNVLTHRTRNSGLINADGGQVMLTAWDASQVVQNVVNNEGVIQARSVEKKNGVVILHGGPTGTVLNSGIIDVSGNDSGETGGTVHILGENVGVIEEAVVNASGAAGGGDVLIGGDRQGGNPAVQNAQATYIGPNTTVRADATESGDGGRVIAFAQRAARVYGLLSARGGPLGGNGGFIETSGKHYFDIGRTPDVTASNGQSGTWLIDPYNIEIVAGGGSSNIVGGPDFTSDGTSATLGADLITAALAEGGTVTITTGEEDLDASPSATPPLDAFAQPGNITVSSDLNFDGSEEATLNLFAHNDININANIFDGSQGDGDRLNLSMTADSDTNGRGKVNVASGVTVDVGDGDLGIAADDVNIQGELYSSYRVYVTPRDNGTIGVDGAVGTGDVSNICGGACGLTLSGTELQNIHAPGGLSFVVGNGSNDDVFVSGLTAAHTANQASTDFRSAGDVHFTGDSSEFSSTVNALPLGDVVVDAEISGNNINLSPAGNVWVNANINAADSFYSFSPLGAFQLAGGKSITALNDVFLSANDVHLDGSVVASAVHVNTTTSYGTIGLGEATGGLTLDNDEIANITADELLIGDSVLDTSEVTVDSMEASHISEVSIQATAPGNYTGQVTFVGNSNFNNLTLNAGDLVLVDGNIVTLGNFLASVEQQFLIGGQAFPFTLDGIGRFELTAGSTLAYGGTSIILAPEIILNGTLQDLNAPAEPPAQNPPTCDGSSTCVVALNVPNVTAPEGGSQFTELVKEGTQSTFISLFIADSKTNC